MTRLEHSIIDFFDLESPYVTEFRRLLHRVFGKGQQRELKSIMMTSAMLSEGKSTVLVSGPHGRQEKGLQDTDN